MLNKTNGLKSSYALIASQGINILGTVKQRLSSINPKSVMGSGTLTDVIIQALQSGAEMLIVDRDLTPT